MICSSHTRDDGCKLLVISGEVDMAGVAEIRDAGAKLLVEASDSGVAVDLMDVSFIDSTGLGALIGLRNATMDSGLSFVLLDPSARVTRILELTGLVDSFVVRRTLPLI
jgi:anti-sigma B factor antagonist